MIRKKFLVEGHKFSCEVFLCLNMLKLNLCEVLEGKIFNKYKYKLGATHIVWRETGNHRRWIMVKNHCAVHDGNGVEVQHSLALRRENGRWVTTPCCLRCRGELTRQAKAEGKSKVSVNL